MNKKVVHIILVFAALLNFSLVLGQKDSLEVNIDNSKVLPLHFSDDLSEKYNGSEFYYDTTEAETQNYLARFLNWIFRGIQDMFGVQISPEMAKLIETLIYILLICIAIYIIVKALAGKDAVSFFRKKNTLVAPIPISEEHIEKINLDELIKNALKEKNYRLAIRYMYLKALQDLSIKNFIDYHFEKTNTDYYREISDITLKQNFNRVSYLYDYIWYGKFDLDEASFINAKQSFDQLNQNINTLG
ncbi:hypothetical protein M0D21_14955 [Aquimarina sp. D1M17]|uniref:hypothetical protein n=1 Tax=Aquimarina acroporae TaxID=2937283 RepID=UPI0020BE53C7|nr:hypothetical protein [Aquimarina acroporae]MCK8522875.1 hypothetical protein [Aquimarina acroporae]